MRTMITGANIILEKRMLANATLYIEDNNIIHIGMSTDSLVDWQYDEKIAADGCFVFPGFIDLHVHGGNGADVADLDSLAVEKLCQYHAQHGTTSLLLTTGPLLPDDYVPLLQSLAKEISRFPVRSGSYIRGIHLEGPFISKHYAGAYRKETIQEISMDVLLAYLSAAEGHIRVATLAPELQGAEVAIKALIARNIVVSAGHSNATYEEMEQAIEWGVRQVTHCYNAMRGFSHRDPGMLGSAWLNENVIAEYICDFVHSHPVSAKLLLQLKQPRKIALITDASKMSGMQTEPIRNSAGTLAGSTITMGEAVKNAIVHLNVSPSEASIMASLTPAVVLGIDDRTGSIEVGKDADLVVMDQNYKVLHTFVQGKRCI